VSDLYSASEVTTMWHLDYYYYYYYCYYHISQLIVAIGLVADRKIFPMGDPSSNLAQCRLTTLIEANELTTTLRRHLCGYKLLDQSTEFKCTCVCCGHVCLMPSLLHLQRMYN